jgi:hypothetical protein
MNVMNRKTKVQSNIKRECNSLDACGVKAVELAEDEGGIILGRFCCNACCESEIYLRRRENEGPKACM